MAGCAPAKNLHYFGEADLETYRTSLQEIEYPIVDQPTPETIVYSQKPRTVKELSEDAMWDMTLQEAMQLAIANNKMIRQRANSATLVQNPSLSPSVYDPAIRQSGFLFGNRGVEAALADFDAQFTSGLVVGRNQSVFNQGGSTLAGGFVNNSNTGVFTSSLSKVFATGGTLSLNHNWNYLDTNVPGVLFPSSYTGFLQAQFTQPLWGQSGVEYTRIAGPNRSGFGSITGVSQGVTIARINEDISLADFEQAVQSMVKDVEDLYWELFLAYRRYDAAVANQESALRSWREVKAKMEVGAIGGNASAEAQARENYFDTRAQVETQLNNIYSVENQFRRLLGLAVNDGRVIRPADSPLFAEYVVNWESVLSDALTRRVELQRQKWQIKSLELQLAAAENAANPQLNFVSSYQLNGFGDDLALTGTMADGLTRAGYRSAYGTLVRGDLTGWTLGFQFAMPVGLRAANAQKRNIELQLMKARAGLAAAEQDISHDLADSLQKIDVAYQTAQSNLDRRVASEARVEATQAEYEAEVAGATLDLVLRAQASRAASEIAFFTSVVQYNQAINELNHRRGLILEINNIHLSEAEWHGEAQHEALRRAWARSFAHEANHLKTEPEEFSSPVPYPKSDLFWGAQPMRPDEEVVPPMPAPEDEPSDDGAGRTTIP
jgi:outer membrane protein TolC